jgi:hypothetical protein
MKLGSGSYIVSLTSFPARINFVWIVIESILRQTTRPDAIFLWLSSEEFPARLKQLPTKLLGLQRRGLEIKFCPDNLMPHKKYFYTVQEYPDTNIITIDDDMIYHPLLLENLINANKTYPNTICCSITREIKFYNGQIMPYGQWPSVKKNTEPTYKLLTMGGGGTLFPPRTLHKEAFDAALIKKNALKTDDLWLKVHSLRKGTKVTSVAGEYPRFFLNIRKSQKRTLKKLNLSEGNNDIVFRNLIRWYHMEDLNNWINQ